MQLTNGIKKLMASFKQIEEIHEQFKNDYKSPKMILGKMKADSNSRLDSITKLSEVEFQVFSQWGDDGIIQYLISKINFEHKTFIEFGVENYKESNTRFLLLNNNWSGLVLDGSKTCVDFIRNDTISWTHDIYAQQAFITKENINDIIVEGFLNKRFSKEVGILSVDIDGNDFWVWKEINVINPIVIIVEYNAFFGESRAITIPYRPDFVMDIELSPYYWGASLKAFCLLGNEKGYEFIGCNSNGNNAYFIRKDKIGSFKVSSIKDGYVRGKFRLKLDEKGEAWSSDRIAESLKGQVVVDVESNRNEVL